MRNRSIFILAGIGAAAGLIGAHFYGIKKPAEAPVFNPAPNPFVNGIYANGIVESYQTNGQNINLFPEVGGTVKNILVKEGEEVSAGQPLVELDDSIQKATVGQLKAQAEAAHALLDELKA